MLPETEERKVARSLDFDTMSIAFGGLCHWSLQSSKSDCDGGNLCNGMTPFLKFFRNVYVYEFFT